MLLPGMTHKNLSDTIHHLSLHSATKLEVQCWSWRWWNDKIKQNRTLNNCLSRVPFSFQLPITQLIMKCELRNRPLLCKATDIWNLFLHGLNFLLNTHTHRIEIGTVWNIWDTYSMHYIKKWIKFQQMEFIGGKFTGNEWYMII